MINVNVFNSVGGVVFFDRMINHWRASGLAVGSYSAVHGVSYRATGGLFSRLLLRWRMYIGFSLSCWWRARRSRVGSIHLATTNPFFLPALVSRATSGRKTTINLLYDLYPEALVHAGVVRPGSWLAGRCAEITRYSLRECDVTVFLGTHLQAYVEATYGPARRAVTIPVGADGSLFKDFSPRALAPKVKPRILYCGQMGRLHDVETLLAAWDCGEVAALDWAIHAGGADDKRLRAKAKERDGVIWGGGLSDPDWVDAMKQSPVALVTIAPGAETVVMPSKTYSALVAGQAILAICPMKSDLADLVQKHDCGWVVEPGDVSGFRCVLTEILNRPEILLQKRTNAFEAGHSHYDVSVIATRWIELFRELGPLQTDSI